jgi:hypothetical protein
MQIEITDLKRRIAAVTSPAERSFVFAAIDARLAATTAIPAAADNAATKSAELPHVQPSEWEAPEWVAEERWRWEEMRSANRNGYRKMGWQTRLEPNDGALYVREKKTDRWRRLAESWASYLARRKRHFARMAAKKAGG